MLQSLRSKKQRSTYQQWQRTLWLALLVWWCIGTIALVIMNQNYQWEWTIGCLLGALQAISLNWVGNQVKKLLKNETTTSKGLIGKLLLLSFVKVTLVAFCIIAFGGGIALKSVVVMLGFLGYNCCIVFVSAFCCKWGSLGKPSFTQLNSSELPNQ